MNILMKKKMNNNVTYDINGKPVIVSYDTDNICRITKELLEVLINRINELETWKDSLEKKIKDVSHEVDINCPPYTERIVEEETVLKIVRGEVVD